MKRLAVLSVGNMEESSTDSSTTLRCLEPKAGKQRLASLCYGGEEPSVLIRI